MTVLLAAAGISSPAAHAKPLDDVFQSMYRLDFADAHFLLDEIESSGQDNPLVPVTRAAAHLFDEMNRMGILASEFYQDRGQRLREVTFTASASGRREMFAALTRSRELAGKRLAARPADVEAHFALALASGIECNYAVFVEKRRYNVLGLARRSHRHALRVLEIDPNHQDARLIIGVNEYMVGSLPFFVRWFVRFRQVEGSRQKGTAILREVARGGRYLSTLAKVVLAMVYIREHKLEEGRILIQQLSQEYPNHPVFERELAVLDTRIAGFTGTP